MKTYSIIRGLLLLCLFLTIIQSVTAFATKPESPTPLSPGNNYAPGEIVYTTTPTFKWNGVSGVDYYTLSISKYPYVSEDIVYNSNEIHGSSITIPSNILVPGEKYRWNMQAYKNGIGSDISWTLYFTLETGITQTPTGNPISTNAKTTLQSTFPTQTKATGLSSSGNNSSGGDNYLQYVIVGIFIAMIAGGGFVVLKRKTALKNSQSISSSVSQTNVPQSPPSYAQPIIQKETSHDQMPVQSSSSTDIPSELLSQYQDVKYLGRGGFARIFSAKKKNSTPVAIKVPLSMDPASGKSFVTELQNWTRLEQENIVRIYDFNVIPVPYFEMELCDSSFAEIKKPVEAEEAAWLIFNVCEGLKYAHKRSIVHRDLKPQNILMKNGVPKISDWGLSKVISDSTSTTTTTSFTPYYAAPEQVSNKVKDERTDIWQLGVILYELVTGALPFTGDSMIEIGMNIATKDPRCPADINPSTAQVEPIILKCLKKDPAERYQSVLELQKALGLLLRKNYTEQFTMSVSTNDFRRSAFYCGDLVMINLLTGDIATAYKYLSDLTTYAEGDVKAEAMELSMQLRNRMEYGIAEIPDELIQKAEIIVHKVSLHFRN